MSLFDCDSTENLYQQTSERLVDSEAWSFKDHWLLECQNNK